MGKEQGVRSGGPCAYAGSKTDGTGDRSEKEGLTMNKWEIKKDGETKCHGDCLQSLPSDNVLAGMRAAGYKVYIDGQLQKGQRKGKKVQ